MAVDLEAVAAEIAVRLKLDAGEADDAAALALGYVVRDTGTPDEDMEPDDLSLFQGLVLLGMRIYQDTPNTPLSEFNQELFGGLVQAKFLHDRIDEYWQHLRLNWGIA